MSDKLVTIDLTNNPHEADMVKLVLEQAGFDVFLDNRNTVEMDWLLSNAIGNIRVQVREAEVERARQVLDEHRAMRKQMNQAQAQDPDAARCLACGEAMPDDADTCAGCGWSYAEGQEPEAS